MFAKAGLVPEEGKLAFADSLDQAFVMVGAKMHGYRRRRGVGPVRVHVLNRHKQAMAKSPQQLE
jgi:hypothetical protein